MKVKAIKLEKNDLLEIYLMTLKTRVEKVTTHNLGPVSREPCRSPYVVNVDLKVPNNVKNTNTDSKFIKLIIISNDLKCSPTLNACNF